MVNHQRLIKEKLATSAWEEASETRGLSLLAFCEICCILYASPQQMGKAFLRSD